MTLDVTRTKSNDNKQTKQVGGHSDMTIHVARTQNSYTQANIDCHISAHHVTVAGLQWHYSAPSQAHNTLPASVLCYHSVLFTAIAFRI